MARGKREPGTSWERRDRSQEVIAAAIGVFYDKGYADASMQDVADKVGVLKGSLYHYIDSKEQLLFGILAQSHAEAVALTEEVLALDGVTPLQQLRAYLEMMATWYLTHIERVSIYFREADQLTGERLGQVQAEQRATARYLRRLLIAAQESGDIRADRDPRLSALLIFGTMNSFPDWYRVDGPHSPGTVVSTFVDWTLTALGVSPAALASSKRPGPGP